MSNLNFLFSSILIYYKIAFIFTFICIYANVLSDINYNLKKLNKKNNYLIMILLIIFFFLIKPVLIISLLMTTFIFLTFVYKNIFKKKIEILKYKKIKKFYDFFINIYIYKYNSIFTKIYMVINYDKFKNIGTKNKINNIKSIILNLFTLYCLGISIVYVNLILNITLVISKSIDAYNNDLKKEKTIFVIFFLIYLNLITHFNEKIYNANIVNSNNAMFNSLDEKNGFIEFYIKEVIQFISNQPHKIHNFIEIKKKLDNFIENDDTLNKKSTKINLNKYNNINKTKEDSGLNYQIIEVLAGNKNRPNIVHPGIQLEQKNIENKNHIIAEIFSTENPRKVKILNNTETIKGIHFNTTAEVSVINTNLVKENKEFSEKFKENNNIQNPIKEQFFLENRAQNIKKKILDENLQVNVIEKKEEYVDLLSNQLKNLQSSVSELLIYPNTDVRDIVCLVSKDTNFLKKSPYIQNKIINNINQEIEQLSDNTFKDIMHNLYTKKEIKQITIKHLDATNKHFGLKIDETKNNTDDTDNF